MTPQKTIAVGLAAITAAAAVSGAAGGSSATKQRVGIEVRLNLATGKGTFTLTPLTPGPLKKDSGTIIGGGTVKPPVIKENGQRMILINGKDSHTGKNGTFALVQRVESVRAGHGWDADTGTFKFTAGTGAYAGVTGGGGFAAAGPPDTGTLYAREEGYLYIR